MEKIIENFTSVYSVSKTLKFKLIPVGATQNNLEQKKLIHEDEERAIKYKQAKKIIDRYHIHFIDKVLNSITIENLDGYAQYVTLWEKADKDDTEKKLMENLEEKLRKQISDYFIKNPEYKEIQSEKMIKQLLPDFLTDDSELEVIKSFKGFYTAFSGYQSNRDNMYSAEKKSTAISYRIINENLPRYLSNLKVFKYIKDIFAEDDINNIETEILEQNYRVKDFFDKDFYACVISQSGIDLYNAVIGGIVKDDQNKVQGLNELINLYNQKNKEKLPKFKPLFKQVLSDRASMSFIEEKFESDEAVLASLRDCFSDESFLSNAINEIAVIFENLDKYDAKGIYVKNGLAITTISNDVYGSWNIIKENWNREYDIKNLVKKPKDYEKYDEKKRNSYKKIESFSLQELNELGPEDIEMRQGISLCISNKIKIFYQCLNNAKEILSNNYTLERKLQKNTKIVSVIKDLLDSVKDIETYIKMFEGTNKEIARDEAFYGDLLPMIDQIRKVDSLYNMVRNYVTQKPYKTDKFKLYFQNPQFLNGWDKDKETDYRVALLRKDNRYYLAVIDREDSRCLQKIIDDVGECFEKMEYKQVSGASKMLPKCFFPKKDIKKYGATDEIISIYNNKTFLKGDKFNLEHCHKIIDYYKDAINQYSWSKEYDYHFSDTKSYEDISGFFREVEEQSYKLTFKNISKKEVDRLVEEGKIFLFEIYSKDFSEYSHGKENLHTSYFKLIFDEKNQGEIRLCGYSEMFMRPASIKKEDLISHVANVPIQNKNKDNPKKTSVFDYTIYKDKRYSENQFEIHIPIIINKSPKNSIKINSTVRNLLKEKENPYVIGIDRGERNLLYIVVVDGKGQIVEQFSLNQIINKYNEISMKTDYHNLLDIKEQERNSARKNWSTIENIKELKEGYISQVVHKICELVFKYDAVIALEDLNSGFKNSRIKVEKQVYQKFEKMLITKLNYMTNKDYDLYQSGGILHGYQLTEVFKSFREMNKQNGFMFYIPAWLTSKIDPATGFVNLINTKYTSVKDAQNLISEMDSISYDVHDNMFVFNIDYSKFPRTDADYLKKWKIYTNGERIKIFRNSEKNGEFDFKVVNVTQEFKELFKQNEIDISVENLKEQILKNETKDFYVSLLELLSLTLQMRNSIPGDVNVDYLISPVKNSFGKFYDSREVEKNKINLPQNADANGAYNIARKVLWAIEQLKTTNEDDLTKVKIAISNKEWLKYAQTHCGE